MVYKAAPKLKEKSPCFSFRIDCYSGGPRVVFSFSDSTLRLVLKGISFDEHLSFLKEAAVNFKTWCVWPMDM